METLLEEVLIDESSNNLTQISFVFDGKLKINKTSAPIEYSHLLNDTKWHRNFSLDE